MALLNKIRKDIKKSSYYVWFLGAQESKGLRGAEYIIPVLKSLVQREKTVEPFKITLQVSQKGLKIVQNLSNLSNGKKLDLKPNKNDVIKHVIPHHAVTSVYQKDDVVACVLLLYNPVTRCPVHVHAYRCDTMETASLLTQQLSTLIEKPENQRKMNEIEGRLHAKGLLPTVPRVNVPRRVNSSNSDALSTASPTSESSGGSSSGGPERLSHLYDSLAAELREKLGMSTDGRVTHAPILLPPRDYDTVHRQKGNLTGIELRKCLNENIIGAKLDAKTEKKFLKTNLLNRMMGSSGGSSGIGSDHPSSPDDIGPSQNLPDALVFNNCPANSTSDEEWAEPHGHLLAGPSSKQPTTPLNYQVKKVSLHKSDKNSEKYDKPRNHAGVDKTDADLMMAHSRPPSNIRIPIENFRKRNEKGSLSPVGVVAPRRRTNAAAAISHDDNENYKKRIPGYKQKSTDKEITNLKSLGTSQSGGTMKLSPQERFLDAKTKFLKLEKERLQDHERNFQNIERKKHSTTEMPISPEIIQTRPHRSKDERIISDRNCLPRRNSFFDEEATAHVGKTTSGNKHENVIDKRQRISRSDSCAALLFFQSQHPRDVDESQMPRNSAEFNYEASKNFEEPFSCEKNTDEIRNRDDYTDADIRHRISQESQNSNYRNPGRGYNDEESNAQWFQYSKMNRRNGCESGRYLSPLRGGVAARQMKPMNESPVSVPYEREIKNKSTRIEQKQKHKNPFISQGNTDSTRHGYNDEPRAYKMRDQAYQERRSSVGAYQPTGCGDNADDENVIRHANYQQPRLRMKPSSGYYRESEYFETDAYVNKSNDMDAPRSSQIRLDKLPARYRHSFVDPGSANARMHTHDIVQRTNSTASSARVGIAAVHLY